VYVGRGSWLTGSVLRVRGVTVFSRYKVSYAEFIWKSIVSRVEPRFGTYRTPEFEVIRGLGYTQWGEATVLFNAGLYL
jgi:hypothetical protein